MLAVAGFLVCKTPCRFSYLCWNLTYSVNGILSVSCTDPFITDTLEHWLGLKINREKTRIVKLSSKDQRLECLGYQIGLAPDLKTRQHYYWRLEPSAKALRRELVSPCT